MMIDGRVERHLFDEAIRLGEYQADRVIDLVNEVRQLRRAMHHAIGCIHAGNAEKALAVLKEELRSKP